MDKIEIPKLEIPHYRSDFGTWVQCGDGIDLTKKETRDNVPGSNLKEKVGACIIGVLTQFDFYKSQYQNYQKRENVFYQFRE